MYCGSRRMSIVDKSSKARYVTSEDDEVETKVEEYAVITEDEIRTNVRKEKSHKIPKEKIPKNVFVLVDDEDVTYVEENLITERKKKLKLDHSRKFMAKNEDPSENSKGRKEIVTPGDDLEEEIIKTK